MIRKCLLISTLTILAAFSGLSAQENAYQYGKKSSFELSAGISLASSSHDSYGSSYSLGLLPYANHFIFQKIFLRYDMGLVLSYTKGYYESFSLGAGPGMGAGYSFALSDRWHLNVSMGYTLFFGWAWNSYFGSSSGASGSLNFYPEIKYLITEKWALSVTTRIQTNLHRALFGRTENLFATTSVFVAASYLF